MNKEPYTSTRIWNKTIQKLRMLHALTGESIVSILDRLADQALDQIKQVQKGDSLLKVKDHQTQNNM